MKSLLLSGLLLHTLAASSFAADPVVYKIDKAHTSFGFAIRHMVVSKTRGTFDEFEGSLTTQDGKLVAAGATLQVASINTKNQDRDDHLKNEDFFNAAKFPTLQFKATNITNSTITGELTMMGVTKKVDLSYSLSGPLQDPWGNLRIGIEAEGVINRKDWGLVYNTVLEGGGLALGEEVELQISIEGIKPKE